MSTRSARTATIGGALALVPFALTSPAAAITNGGDVPVTGHRYVKANGRAADATTTACSTNRRQQNEPSAAMDYRKPSVVIAGANDYCTVPTNGGTWVGYYRSTNGGRTWVDGLLPGYPQDNSPEGKASPLHQKGITNAGDPVQAWDTKGNAYFMGNAFNRTKPANGSVWVARYSKDGAHYDRTVIVGRGTPTSLSSGRFNDKTAIEVDRSTASPYTDRVYVAWSEFQRSPGNTIYFAYSADGGRTFKRTKVSQGGTGNQFADIAVTRNGTVYVAWRSFGSQGGQSPEAMVYAKSTDGGKHFTRPAVLSRFIPFDAADEAGDPAAAERAHERAFRRADGPESEAGEAPGDSRDCGVGPFRCKSGYVFFRHDSQIRITADPTARDNAVYAVFDASKPGTVVESTSTYQSAEAGEVGVGRIMFSKSVNGGRFSTARVLSDPAKGHQLFPDINADHGVLSAVWYDSRRDSSYSVQRPAGNAGGKDAEGYRLASANGGMDAYGATSRNGGASFSTARLTSTSFQPNYLMFGDRQVPFQGDYNYVTNVGSKAFGDWTDNRRVVPGSNDDPRNPGADGFKVKQCRASATAPDTCPDSGGLDQEIYGATFTP